MLPTKLSKEVTAERWNINQAGTLGVRHLQAMLLSTCLASNNVQEVNSGLALYAMTLDSRNKWGKKYKKFTWEPHDYLLLSSSYFYTSILGCLLSCFIASRYNNKALLLSVGGVSGVILCYVTPILTSYFGYRALLVIRLIQGFTQGIVIPVVYGQMARWIPPLERNTICPMIISGRSLGAFFVLSMGGFLVRSIGGWPSLYYFCANCGLVWCVAYLMFGAQDPNQCFYIGEPERQYINASLRKISQATTIYRRYTPWKKAFMCVPIYAMTISVAGFAWIFQSNVTQAVSLFHGLKQLSLVQAGLGAACSSFFKWLFTFPIAFAVFILIRKKYLNTHLIRFGFNTIGQWGCASGLLFRSYAKTTFEQLLCQALAGGVNSFQSFGSYMNPFDLAPNYTCLVSGMAFTGYNIAALIAPFICKKIQDLNKDGWRDVLIIDFYILCFCNLVFIILGRAERQPWDENTWSQEQDEDDNGNLVGA